MGFRVKLSFACLDGKKCCQHVPIEVADQVPLFARMGICDFTAHKTTLSALSLYWKCYKRQQPIPLSATLQERIDFIKLAEYLGEELFNDRGFLQRDIYCELYATADSFEQRSRWYHHVDDTTKIHIRSGGKVVWTMNCWKKDAISYSVHYEMQDCSIQFFENGKLVDPDAIYMEETTFDIVRDCDTIFDLLPCIPRRWNRNLPLEKCDREYLLHLLQCFRRVCPTKLPTDVLSVILKDTDFYEDWNRIVGENLAHLPKSAVRFMINEYYITELVSFKSPQIVDKVRNFVTVWPQMANLVWKTIARSDMAAALEISKKRRTGFMNAKTPNELLLYYGRIGRIEREDAGREEQLMVDLMNARSLVEEIKCQERLDRFRRGNRLIGRTDAATRRLYVKK